MATAIAAVHRQKSSAAPGHGSIWAAKAWGRYWVWDPRLTTSMLSVLIYVAYVVVRSFAGDGQAERKFAGVTHVNVTSISRAQVDEITSLCVNYNVKLSGLGYYPNPLDPDAAVAKHCTDHLRKVIVAAEKLGLTNVNTFVGRDWTKTVDENWPRFLKTWRPLVAFAEDHGIKIGIENCPMRFTKDEWPGGKNLATTPVIWRRMFSDIPSRNFGLNYDPSHMVLQHMDPIAPLREFQNKLFHLHAKDVKLRPR